MYLLNPSDRLLMVTTMSNYLQIFIMVTQFT